MYYNKVEICGVNTAKLKTLTHVETLTLLEQARLGSTKARDALIYGNLRLVLSVLQRFHHRTENIDDLFQVGCIGLIKAIDNFNTELNVKFSTYAVPMIIGEIRRYLRDNNAIRISRSMRDTAYKALSAKERLINKNFKEPTIDEIAEEMGVTRREVSAALDLGAVARVITALARGICASGIPSSFADSQQARVTAAAKG